MSSGAFGSEYKDGLYRFEKKGNDKGLFKALVSGQNQSDFIDALDFLKEKIVDQKTHNSDFYAVYSMLLERAGVKDTAASMAAATMLILYTDRARCADETAGQMKITKRFSMLRESLEYLSRAKGREKNEIIEIAMNMEERIDARPPNRNLCYTGIKATQDALKYAKSKGIKLEKSGEDSFVIPDFDHVKVEYVSKKEWHEKRAEIRRKFPSYFQK